LVSCERIIPALLLVCVASATVRADMMSDRPDVTCNVCACLHVPTTGRLTSSSEPLSNLYRDLADLRWPPVAFPGDRQTHAWRSPRTPPVRILADRHSSLELCLYSLIGLALCTSGHWVKGPSADLFSEWYSGNGRFPGSSCFARSRGCLFSTAVCALRQPDGAPPGAPCRVRLTAVIALWRQSQFTPCVLASRGPPRS